MAPTAPRRYDVCNGDADGLCAVLQWRLHEPLAATLITGLKRDIALLQQVPAHAADEVLVCDVSMQRNREALLKLLAAGVRVRYVDHHATGGELPAHPGLDAHIDMSRDLCSSLLMNRLLGGRFLPWALVGAYGDEMVAVAERLAIEAGFDPAQRTGLRRLGQAINYNAYGEDERDVCIAPARLYRIMARHTDPLAMLAHEPIVDELSGQRRSDLHQALALPAHWQGAHAQVVLLPDAAWSRRVVGVLANELMAREPQRTHAVLVPKRSGDYGVSLRVPRGAAFTAEALCAPFGGSGRAGAAGIDALPPEQLERFIASVSDAGTSGSPV